MRPVNIYELNVISLKDDLLELFVRCSKGTYIRTLVSDIGKALGCGAHVVALRRLTVGAFKEEELVQQETLETLAKMHDYAKLDRLLLPVVEILSSYPEVCLTETMTYYLRQGQAVIVSHAPVAGLVKLMSKDGQFLGVGKILSDGRVAPYRLTKN
jgi:tRNA pseudouridine55 synthase